MAVRDRNLFAWQAYVITMAFVSVGLLLGMFFLWRSYSDLSKRNDDQATQLADYRQQFLTSEERVERLMAMLGFGEHTEDELKNMATKFANDEKLGEVEQEFAEQMNLFAPNVAAGEKNLINLPKYLLDTVRVRNNNIDAARQRETQLMAEMASTVQRETKAREDAVRAQQAAQADLEAERQKHAQAIAKLNSEKDETLQKFTDYERTFNQQLAQLKGENQQLSADNQQKAETIASLMDDINQFRNPDFAAPQGEIVRTANGGTTVWVNLGRDDGLREGVPFSVIDESAVNISEATPKAKMVITRVISDHPHLAVAKVTDYDYRNPLMTGDKIYSPAWRPGRTPGFALVGMMDVDDDGRDDIEQVRELIRLSGGSIDAVLPAKGNREDTPGLSTNTLYLVMGTDLHIPAGASPELRAERQAQAEKYASFINEARSKGVMQINLDKLMGYLKTEGADRTVPLGNRLRGEDFLIPSEGNPPTSSGRVSELFQPRSP